ncbi:3,4-dihydroxy-2-butanone-4-phosphate synthase [Gilvimarinus agarilyticus]|uniref:bifunctional 3,4-dihydroxy-2-butanone-4-phosphate synthase/GTP cyclohydrolase II n=1 Tax=unclassified Gilvimarinus TaxID=2642066 RepID=UPI001C092D49|nr:MULTISPECIES: bifunctional 3,4-dihydroxy-2-butanone-4-phosphate synthase/GTP cyclohydrolase II [unclassified Gilvimarinus]MBU2885773.1 3,4-dihydroxy-2-butanone-4-phosphate synthase [Gilvimarinus agarilyticus]MDO6570626.1 bifunctional 3,4-dihydroxy-2-butanone-4-phosphate synthase/GTP cyclohydrolase II [Gilvimarinus sp. 2_MG-2023]MDO6746201.1 bifunctional 3,4-dihydroxy-2-butanone-4-phosphate synthase/GTP cyclohydrolase II [Gilvimarinus sp. 1_MG-2023]
MELNTVDELLDDLRQGKMIILMDDENRENEGDLIMVAEQVRAEDINFMASHARGLICLTLTPERCTQLGLPLMVQDNKAKHSTNFTTSIEAAEGVTTGISAADRARTVRVAVSGDAKPADIVQPGHIFPIMAQPGGVMSRAGHTEAGCDLARMAGFESAAVIVEIMNPDGSMARRPELEEFAKVHGLKIGTIAELIHYRATKEQTVECINQRSVQTQYGDFALHTYRDTARGDLHFALVKGEITPDEPTLVRVHVMDTARDLLAIKRPATDGASSWTYGGALEHINQQGCGVLVLICHDECTSDVEESIDWLLSGRQQRRSPDVVYKQVGTGSQILRDLGVSKMRVMSAPMRFSALSGFDLEVVDYVSPESN